MYVPSTSMLVNQGSPSVSSDMPMRRIVGRRDRGRGGPLGRGEDHDLPPPSRAALLVEAFGSCAGPPDTGSVRQDARAVLGGPAGKLRDAGWRATMPSLLDAGGRDPEPADVHAATIAERRGPLADVLRRTVARGELPPRCERRPGRRDARRAARLPGHGLGEPLDEAVIDGLVTAVPPAPGPGGAAGG
jgi:hypothetical protein